MDNTYRNRVIIDDSDDSVESAGRVESSPGGIMNDTSVVADAPLTAATVDKHAITTVSQPRRQRKFSFDSILSDSSEESIGALFRKASISKRLLSKPPAEVDFNVGMDSPSSSSDDSDPEQENRDTSVKVTKKEDDKEIDLESAWCQNEDSKDYYLSGEKVTGVHWPEIRLPSKLYHQLFSFQRQGVQWMASLHTNCIGGILGDDMGMGKTYTTLAYLGGLMRAGTIQNALIIAPLSVLRSWEKEAWKILRLCVPSIKVTVFNSEVSKIRRMEIIRGLTKKKKGRMEYNLVVTTYGLIRSATSDFSSNSKIIWDYVALDEGHQIKNSSAEVSKACRAICSPDTRRLLLTGTPILNNLKELWSLFDFATSGKILGTSKNFSSYYGKHIESARDRLATQGEIELGQRKNAELQSLIHPYFLQRLKIDFLKDKLPQKHDVVVWTHLSNEQRHRYTDFVESKDGIVRSILTGDVTSPLEAVTWLKKLCGHPILTEATGQEMSAVLRHKDRDEILNQSAKLQVLVALVKHLKQYGHRPLIFSQSTKMLDTINFVLRNEVVLARIDGSTPERDRQHFVDAFNRENSRYDAMLLSTKAAGCGLTLIGADTNIIYDPSWTPAEDAQAVDRCYRIGQTKEVTVYRLIAAGTVEEKTYEKQIHKDGIRRAVLSKDQKLERYFEREELRSLFKLGGPGMCRVMNTLKDSGAAVDLDRFEFVYDLDAVIGITRHDGFYASGGDTNKGAFDGSAKSKPVDTPTIMGKSQRVLAGSKSPTTVPSASVGSPDYRKLATLGNMQVKSLSGLDASIPSASMTQKENGSGQTEIDLPLRSPKLDSKNIASKMLDSASEHASNGRPRKALEVLIDIVESGIVQDEEKLQVHSRTAHLAASLGLL